MAVYNASTSPLLPNNNPVKTAPVQGKEKEEETETRGLGNCPPRATQAPKESLSPWLVESRVAAEKRLTAQEQATTRVEARAVEDKLNEAGTSVETEKGAPSMPAWGREGNRRRWRRRIQREGDRCRTRRSPIELENFYNKGEAFCALNGAQITVIVAKIATDLTRCRLKVASRTCHIRNRW